MQIFIGTYTEGSGSDGIYRCNFDAQTGELSDCSLAHAADNPAYVMVNGDGSILYAVNERTLSGEPEGAAVRAYGIDRADGTLSLIGEQPVDIAGPCHLSVAPDQRAVFAACYQGGGVAMVPLDANGAPQPSISVAHAGSSVHPERQTSPHAHSANVTADGSRLVVADLGTDNTLVYGVSYDPPALTELSAIASSPGAGPRHLAFAPRGDRAYLMGEMDMTITTLSFEPTAGTFAALQTISTLTPDSGESAGGENSTADVHVHPNGRFVYSSNRGPDSISVYAIDEKSGELTLLANEPTRGSTPRGFRLTPDGRWLVAANEMSHTLYSFAVDADSGALTATGFHTEVRQPASVTFVA